MSQSPPIRFYLDPRIWAGAIVGIIVAVDVTFICVTKMPNTPALLASGILLQYAAACWVTRDSAKRGIHFPSDQVMWWIMIALPAYLYESRGFKGILIFLTLIAAFTALVYGLTKFSYSVYFSQF